jgi:2-keto-4-pentenoate hydratase/2-oxohepta-3-ene-1,7-dioic acid hydratase in catechol pathway
VDFLRYQSASGPAYGELSSDGTTIFALQGSPYAEHRRGAQVGAIDSLTLLAPVEPRHIFCVGMNYADHVRESRSAVMPEFPL